MAEFATEADPLASTTRSGLSGISGRARPSYAAG